MTANDTSWKKGQSGNPRGRPKGAKSKAMTDRQLAKFLGLRTEENLLKLEELAKNSENSDAFRLKVYSKLLDLDMNLRISEYRKVMEQTKLKMEQEKHKLAMSKEKNSAEAEAEEEEEAQVVFMPHAVK